MQHGLLVSGAVIAPAGEVIEERSESFFIFFTNNPQCFSLIRTCGACPAAASCKALEHRTSARVEYPKQKAHPRITRNPRDFVRAQLNNRAPRSRMGLVRWRDLREFGDS